MKRIRVFGNRCRVKFAIFSRHVYPSGKPRRTRGWREFGNCGFASIRVWEPLEKFRLCRGLPDMARSFPLRCTGCPLVADRPASPSPWWEGDSRDRTRNRQGGSSSLRAHARDGPAETAVPRLRRSLTRTGKGSAAGFQESESRPLNQTSISNPRVPPGVFAGVQDGAGWPLARRFGRCVPNHGCNSDSGVRAARYGPRPEPPP